MILSSFGSKKYLGVEMADIFHNTRSYYDIIIANFDLQDYTIQGDPRPEQLANRLYGDSNLYWALFLPNNVVDPFFEWILPEDVVHSKVEQEYAELGGADVIRHHVNEKEDEFFNLEEYPIGSFIWYDKNDTNRLFPQYTGELIPVTRREHAINENQDKREIEIIRPQDIERFVEFMFEQAEQAGRNGRD